MSYQDDLDRVVDILKSMNRADYERADTQVRPHERPNKRNWYPTANMLCRRFGVKTVMSVYFDLGERVGIKRFIGFLQKHGWERKAALEKARFMEASTGGVRNKNKELSVLETKESGFVSIGEVLGRNLRLIEEV